MIVIILLIILIIISVYQKPTEKDKMIKTLLRQSARWSTAAEQDENAMIAVLHANYGAGYLWALKDIATEKSIKKATGVNIHMFEKKIIGIQDKATKKVSGLCPQFYSKLNTELLVLGGDL